MAGIDKKTLAAARSYAKKTLLGEGALKGKDGKDGEDGVGISDIEKIETEGLTDTYRISLTDGSYFDFSVTNGKDGSGAIETISVNGRIIEPDALKNVEIPIPTTLPASDVYNWAKQPEKPTYTAIEVGADPAGSANSAKSYTDAKLEELIGTSPENLDTIYELAQAILDNKDVIDSINDAISNKVDKVAGKGLSTNDLTDEMIQTWNNKSNFSGSYNDLTDKPQVLISADDAMSDTSENPVQNKVVKGYVDESVGQIKKYQKYVNTELDHAWFKIKSVYVPVKGNPIPFIRIGGNIDIENGLIKLKKGRTYQFICCVSHLAEDGGVGRNSSANIEYGFVNNGSNKIIATFQPRKDDLFYEFPDSINFQYTAEEDCDVCMKALNIYTLDRIDNSKTYLSVFEIGRSIVIDPVEHVNEESGLEDTPVGYIISYMGNTAPKHYLKCDGSIYNISDYPYLAEHINDEFGSYNYFGGDGETTFAVPDLRGEFLRGAGVNSHENNGSGADVGEHQDATQIGNVYSDVSSGNSIRAILNSADNSATSQPRNMDFGFYDGKKELNVNHNNMMVNTDDWVKIFPTYYATRPTNTSVLYCIKYEPTYYMKLQEVNYSYEERRIGTWVDGKPLYEKTVDFGSLPNTSVKEFLHGIENADKIWIEGGRVLLSDGYSIGLSYYNPNVLDAGLWFSVNISNILCGTKADRSNCTAIVTLRYTKTTDN